MLVTLDTVTPEGSEALFGPKNHLKVGGGTFSGRGFEVIVTEQFRVKLLPTALEPIGEIVTAPMSTAPLNLL